MGVGVRTMFTRRQGDLGKWLTLSHLLAVNNYWCAVTFNRVRIPLLSDRAMSLRLGQLLIQPSPKGINLKRGIPGNSGLISFFLQFTSALFSKGFLRYSDTCLVKIFLAKITFFKTNIWWYVGNFHWIKSVSITIKAHVCHRIIVSKNWERPKRSPSPLVSEICV